MRERVVLAVALASERNDDVLPFNRIGDGSREDGSGDGATELYADGVNGADGAEGDGECLGWCPSRTGEGAVGEESASMICWVVGRCCCMLVLVLVLVPVLVLVRLPPLVMLVLVLLAGGSLVVCEAALSAPPAPLLVDGLMLVDLSAAGSMQRHARVEMD
jgi:hypothetical protein